MGYAVVPMAGLTNSSLLPFFRLDTTPRAPIIGDMPEDIEFQTCALCKQRVPELRRSHIMPRWTYRRLRDESEPNPNPVIIENKRAVVRSDQLWQHLLCADCEQRFSERGEDYVSRLAYLRNGECPVYNMVAYSSQVRSHRHSGAPVERSAEALDCGRIVYFAASMYWRSSVSNLPAVANYTLGPTYEEAFRRYLNGIEPFPLNACQLLDVVDQPKGDDRFHGHAANVPPSCSRIDGVWHHVFLVHGLYFHLLVGNLVPRDIQAARCLHHSHTKILSFTALNQLGLARSLAKMVREAGPIR